MSDPSVPVLRCRVLIRDLRASPDEKFDRLLLREFERELDHIESAPRPRPGFLERLRDLTRPS